MEIFSALLALCAVISPVTGEYPSQRPVARSFDVFLWSAPEQQTIDTPVIWDAIALIMTSMQRGVLQQYLQCQHVITKPTLMSAILRV